MRVLFVCSGNSATGIGTVVLNQAESLIKHGVEIDYFTIKGKGFSGYFRSIPAIRKLIKHSSYDIIHSHYSFSGFVASFTSGIPIVASLMGSDAYLSWFWRVLIRLFALTRWQVVIVKTERMRRALGMEKAIVIPNGVDLERFSPMERSIARDYLKIEGDKKLIVFVADPGRSEKNYDLAKEAVIRLNRDDVVLLPVFNVPHTDIPYYLYAANVLLLTSKWEGSVNVVKEAMACSLPIVSTDVGDVRENIEDTTGSFICESDPQSLSEGIAGALNFTGMTNGREKLAALKLDSDSVALRILELYKEVCGEK